MPKLTMYSTVASLALVLAVTAPTTANADEAEVKTGKERSCIHVSSINGFNAIDNKHLTVSVGANKTYLVTLFSRCIDLKWTQDIAYSSTMSWSCSNSMDKIIVEGQRCLIDDIERVEDTATAREIVAAAKETAS